VLCFLVVLISLRLPFLAVPFPWNGAYVPFFASFISRAFAGFQCLCITVSMAKCPFFYVLHSGHRSRCGFLRSGGFVLTRNPKIGPGCLAAIKLFFGATDTCSAFFLAGGPGLFSVSKLIYLLLSLFQVFFQ